MIEINPINQKSLFGLKKYMLEFIRLYKLKIFPNKILLSGLKGVGKSTLAYHFINYVLSKEEDQKYDLDNFLINSNSKTFQTILNKTNLNLITIDINQDKKSIDINQIRELILNLNKSSFNNKPRFVLIDNIEFLNKNSINALLKILEEPNDNIYFILINNNKKVLSTLVSRCINYKINITNQECLAISEKLLGGKIEDFINNDLTDYYITPGRIYHLIKFAEKYKYNLLELDLKKLIKIIIKESLYKKDQFIKSIIFNLIEFYIRKLDISCSDNLNKKYRHFLKKISDTKTFNLDEEILFFEFEEEFLNG